MGKCPDAIKRLIDRFTQQSDQIRSPDYNETLIRIDFINPLMTELGWDIDNRQGFAEQYREVVHEDRVKVAGQTKAPDYSFRIGGARKFFLEAKKPAVDIKNNWEPAYQLRRYAWSAKLACSVLTDFEEFAIYDTRVRPKHLDPAKEARREYIRYTEYCDKWDFLSGTFSKDAVLKGEFDRYCETKKGRGADPFDDAFLGEIEDWRKSLAISLARNNEALDESALNFAVQRIIDRIIFLRIAEDRGTEPPRQLQVLQNGEGTYARLKEIFHLADVRYNSGLFHFEKEKDRDESPDTLTPTLDVDDKSLKGIIKALYYPESPYEFTMVSADILGSVYERFLGKVITLTAGHNAKIEEKPEVRKAGGVYYTPTYIVDYIVKNTVGKLLTPSPRTRGEGRGEGQGASEVQSTSDSTNRSPLSPTLSPDYRGEGVKQITPKEAAKLKILDPACGSGSFLIGAYQFLLDWYFQQYTASDPAALATGKKPVLRPGLAGGWALTIAERKRILLDHIHGVDLDGQAVEVTKLNLLLKCLEGETSQTLGFEQRLFRERALPDLGKNILCGNSLIGTDIIGTKAWDEMSEEERRRINPFDYERAFPQVFKRKEAGFDAVIGNPPYVDVKELGDDIKRLLMERYRVASKRFDLFVPFVERALRVANDSGLCSFILPSTFLTREYGAPLREMLAAEHALIEMLDFGTTQVFATAQNYVCIPLLAKRATSGESVRITQFIVSNASAIEMAEALKGRATKIVREFNISSASLPGSAPWHLVDSREAALFDRIREGSSPLGELLLFASEGIHSGKDEVFFVPKDSASGRSLESPPCHPLARGRDIHRYDAVDIGALSTVVIYPYDLEDGAVTPAASLRSSAPRVWKHLEESRELLRGRPYFEASDKEWYELWCQRNPQLYTRPKIVGPEIAQRGEFTLCMSPLFINNKLKSLVPAPETEESIQYLLGLLNSRLLVALHRKIAPPKGSGFFEVKTRIVATLPFRRIDFEDPKQVKAHDRLTSLVDTMLTLHKRLAAEKLPQRREQIQREIDATDRQIDQLVYQLYGLTADEIKIVEEAASS